MDSMFLIDTSRNGQPVYNALVNQSLDAYLINDLHLEGHGLIFYINDPSSLVATKTPTPRLTSII